MKGAVKRGICGVLVILQVLLLSSCALTYEHIDDNEVGIGYGYSEWENNCFVAGIAYTMGDATHITIPDEFRGAPVTALGGYIGRGVPAPFYVYFNIEDSISEEYETFSTDDDCMQFLVDSTTKVEVLNVEFTITLPKHLKKITKTSLITVTCQKHSDGQNVLLKVFRPVYCFEISEQNEFFYTKDGKLYYRETNQLFSDCIYESSDYSDMATE